MSNPGHSRPGGLRPGFTRLPDGRGRMVVLRTLSTGEELSDSLMLEWGVLYTATERVKATARTTRLAGLRLVGGQETQQMGDKWAWVRIYEDIPETAEIQVGKNRRIEKDDGTIEIVAEFLQLASATAVTVTVGVTAPPAPDAAAAVLADQDRRNDGALRRITRRYVSAGLIAESSRDVEDGFAEVTWTSVRTEQTPPGVVVGRTVNKPNGIPVYVVTTRTTKAGGGVDALTFSYTTDRPFTLPGRLRPYAREVTVATPGAIPTSSDIDIINIYESPPVQVWVAATTTVSYTTTATLGTLSPSRWNPTSWATVDIDVILRGPNPLSVIEERVGYCVVADTPGTGSAVLTVGTPSVGPVDYVFRGNRLFGSNSHTITILGPESPAGTAVTLDADLRPAFVAHDGTRWYRKTQVTATLPAQAALPV